MRKLSTILTLVLLFFLYSVATNAAAEEIHLEPGIKLYEKEFTKIDEYRTNGTVHTVKISPPGGIPYYLVNSEGTGFDNTLTSFEPVMMIPQWVIFRW